MATKQELLDTLSGFDKSTLESLIKYGSLMLIPQPDLLTTVTAVQMVDKAHQFADLFFPEWTDRGKADFGEFLVELMANFSEKDFWYLNALANESILNNMSIYSNAFSRALTLGYTPSKQSNAVYRFRLRFAPSDSDRTIVIGAIKLTSESGVKVSNKTPIFVKAVGGIVDVDMIEGEYEVLNTSFNGKEVRLVKEGIDSSTIQLTINNDTWSRVATFSESDNADLVYTTLPNENSSQKIVFGKDGFGAVPQLSSELNLVYNYGTGSLGNDLPPTGYTVNDTPIEITFVFRVRQVSLGTDQESLGSIKINAPLFFRTKGRLLSASDTISYLKGREDVSNANAVTNSRTLYFYLVAKEELTPTEEAELLAIIEEENAENIPIGFTIQGVSTNYIDLNNDLSVIPNTINGGGISLRAFALNGFNLEDIKSDIRLLIEQFTDPRNRAEYGVNFSLTSLNTFLISNIEGLQNVVFDSVGGFLSTSLPNGEIVVNSGSVLKKVDVSNIFVTMNYIS